MSDTSLASAPTGRCLAAFRTAINILAAFRAVSNIVAAFRAVSNIWRPARNMACMLAAALVFAVGAVGFASAQSVDGVRVARLNPTQDLSGILGPLPEALGDDDIAHYRAIFRLQDQGRWADADAKIKQLDNDLLLGHVLAQRYLHPTAYRSKYIELQRWLDLYADHPQARTIHKLAKKRQPEDARDPRKPISGYLGGSGQELNPQKQLDYVSAKKRTKTQNRAVRRWKARISKLVGRDRPTQARELLRDQKTRDLLDQYEYDWALWTIAKGYFANNMDELAYKFAATAAARSGIHQPMINWTAGLAAFRARLYDKAAEHFVRLVGARLSRPEDRAGAAFWAARSYLLARKPREVTRYLKVAADSSDAFYGILAQAMLGKPIKFDWHEEGLKNDSLSILTRFPGSRRALALGEVGQSALAEKEIRKLAARSKRPLTQALVALSRQLGLPATQMRVAQKLRIMSGRRHDGAMFPIPEWISDGELEVNQALVLAIIRAESAFDAGAVSRAGARGLMQVMPATAKEVSKLYNIRYRGKNQLLDPKTNITFGSTYITWLQNTDVVDDDLLRLILAYNGGIKRVARWLDRLSYVKHDPILFLESVPVPETRNYTKKVLANLWAYRARLRFGTPSLIDLAENKWPAYSTLEQDLGQHAGAY